MVETSPNADVARIVLLSDTHGQDRTLRTPEGEFLIHPETLRYSTGVAIQFATSINGLPSYRIGGGSHPRQSRLQSCRIEMASAHFGGDSLPNESVELDGITI